MTRPEDQEQKDVAAPNSVGEGADEGSKPATVSDENVPSDGSGKHGRPTDDSDPGHS